MADFETTALPADRQSAQRLIASLLDDQAQRWRQGAPVTIEEYLERHPSLRGNVEALFTLIHNELVQRRLRGERPSLDEYQSRFPQLTERLQAYFDHGDTVEFLSDKDGESKISLKEPPTTSLPPAPGMTGPLPSAPPGYEIMGVLGQGGMGVVYKAQQVALKRQVALKMIRGDAASADDLARFRIEAEAIARLQHPNIVQIYEVGEHAGRPFFSLEYIEGGSLAGQLNGVPWPPREAAVLAETLARAVHAAHEKGVIHRDLKPGNILLRIEDQSAVRNPQSAIPKITDFGLAKRLDDDSAQTRTGQVMGTPSYMAPEQASGWIHDIGPHTDVYALGAIIYELLTGRPPIRGATVLETLILVSIQEPVPPSQLQPNVPRDLETICLKCLRKEPARRYGSAEELAEELRRFLDGRPIQARPVGRGERLWRWCRRNPVMAGLTAAVAVSLLGGAIVATIFGIEAQANAKQAHANAKQAHANAKQSDANATRADIEKDRAQAKARDNWRLAYPGTMTLIADAWQKGDVATVEQLLRTLVPGPGQEDLRGPEWHYYWRQVHGERLTIGSEASPCRSVAFLDGGRYLLTGSPGSVKVWDAATGREKATLAADPAMRYEVRPAGASALVLGWTDHSLSCWSHIDGKLERLLTTKADAKNQSLAWAAAPDGKSLAVAIGPDGDKRLLKVWDLATGAERFSKEVDGVPLAFTTDGQTLAVGLTRGRQVSPIVLLAAGTGEETLLGTQSHESHGGVFFRDGRRLLSGLRAGKVVVWDVPAKKEAASFTYGTWADAVALSPDEQLIAAGPAYGAAPIRLWDVAGGKKVRDLWGHSGVVRQLVFAADGATMAAVCGDGTVKLWDLRPADAVQNRLLDPLADTRVRALAFSPNGRLLATAGVDNLVRVWDVASGAELAVLRGHANAVNAVAFSSRGLLASGSSDQSIKIWDLDTGQEQATFRETSQVSGIAFSPDGKTLAIATLSIGLRLRDLSGRQLASLPNCPPQVYRVAFSPDGALIAAACGDGKVRIWETAKRRLRHALAADGASAVAFTPDGRQLVADSGNQAPARWDVDTGLPVTPPLLAGTRAAMTDLSISPDGRYLATGRSYFNYCHVWLWDLQATKKADRPRILRLRESTGGPRLAISPDSRLLAASHSDGTVALFDLATQSIERYLPGHANEPLTAWSADSRVLAQADPDFTIRVLDARTRQPRAVLRGHTGPVSALVLSRDGSTVVSGSFDQTVRIWDVTSGKPKHVLGGHRLLVRSVALSPDGQTVASGDGELDNHGEVRLWDVTSGTLRATLEPKGWVVWSLAFSPDGQTLACGTGGFYSNISGQLSLWDPATGKLRGVLGSPVPIYVSAAYHAEGHLGDIVALAFSPDGKTLASGSNLDGGIRLWDVAERRLRTLLRGHRLGVQALAFAPQGDRLASGSKDGTVRFWRVGEQQACGVLAVGTLSGLTFSPDGGSLMASGPTGAVELCRPVEAVALRHYQQEILEAGAADRANPDYQQVRMQFLVAQLQERTGDATAAAQTRQRAEQLARRVPGAERFQDPAEIRTLDAATLNHRAMMSLNRGEVDEAISQWREAVRLNPEQSLYHFHLGHTLKRAGQLDEAIACYQTAIRLRPDYAGAYNGLGVALKHRGRLDEALAAQQQAARLLPDQPVYQANLGELLRQLGRWTEAEAPYRQLVRLEPSDPDNHTCLGVALTHLLRLDEAAAAFQEAARLRPDRALSHHNLAMVLVQQSKWEAAIPVLREVIRLQPDHFDAHLKLTAALANSKRFDDALVVSQATVRLDPASSNARNNLGVAFLNLGQLDAAISAFREAIRLQPDLVRAHRNLARTLAQKGDLDGAVAAYRDSIRLQPTDGPAHGELMGVLAEKEAWDEAVTAGKEAVATFEKLHAGAPKTVSFQTELARANLRLGRLYCNCPAEQLRDPARALALARKAVDLAILDDASACQTVQGMAHYRAGDWKAALAALEKSLKLRASADGEEWLFLAMTHWRLGNREAAQGWYGKAVKRLEMNPDSKSLRRLRAEAAALLETR